MRSKLFIQTMRGSRACARIEYERTSLCRPVTPSGLSGTPITSAIAVASVHIPAVCPKLPSRPSRGDGSPGTMCGKYKTRRKNGA